MSSKETKFADIAEFRYGRMPDKTKLGKGNYVVFSGYRIVGTYPEYNADENLIIVARGVGGTGDVKITPKKCFVTNLSIIVDLKDSMVDKKFLYYYFVKGLKQLDSGSAQSQITITDLSSLKINLLEHPTQRQIAKILGDLDRKIELNRRMNETLEQIGQRLLKHYFLENPERENWDNRTLGEFFPIRTGKKDANFSTPDGQYPFFTCSQNSLKAPDYSFDGAAILLAGNGDFNIKFYRGKFEAYQRTYVLIPHNEKFLGLLYFLMSQYLSEITGGSRGSVIKFITKGMIEDYIVKLPDDEQLSEVSGQFNKLTIAIEKNRAQIKTLETIRDTLLPKLMDGSIEI